MTRIGKGEGVSERVNETDTRCVWRDPRVCAGECRQASGHVRVTFDVRRGGLAGAETGTGRCGRDDL